MVTPTRMHADEITTDVELVTRLLANQFPEWADLTIAPVSSAGTDNALYRLGDDLVARLPRIHWAEAGIERERACLPRLAPHLPVAVPVPLAHGVPDAGYPYPWSIYLWLPGENPIVDQLPNPERLAREIAHFIAALRRIEPTDGPPAGRTLAMMDGPVRAAIEALKGMVDTDAITTVWESSLRIPEWAGPPVWLHGDLAPGNLLLVDGRLSAVIDFSGVGVGDPLEDLGVAWNLLPASARPVFRAALGVDDATWARGRGRALGQALVQLPYYKDTNPKLAANARHVIREVLAEHHAGDA